MSIAVTTPSGNIGSKLTQRLLDAGQPVTLLARDPGKLERFAVRGARIEQGDVHDRDYVLKATRGAASLFWLTPPDLKASDLRHDQGELGRIAAEAVQANAITRVANLSSLGADLGQGTGPVDGLYDVEKAFDSTGASVAHVRPGFFMENFLMHVPSLRQEGVFYLPVSGKTKVPLIATQDIAEVSAKLLLDSSWSGRKVLPLQGPDTLSFDEIAEVMTLATGKPVKYVQVPYERAREAMAQYGFSRDVVSRFLELYRALETGRLYSGKPEAEKVITRTPFEQFAREVLRPVVQS